MTMPSGCPVTSSPMNTPTVEKTTALMIMNTLEKRLNWASSVAKIRKIAVANALVRKASAFLLSSSSPLNVIVTPAGSFASASFCSTVFKTAAVWTPSATLAVTVMMRAPWARLMIDTRRSGTRSTKLPIGTAPDGVLMRSESSSSRLRRSGG